MEVDFVCCPICNRTRLLKANGIDHVGTALTVCENEFFKHWKIGGHHFLTRTERNIREENDLIFHGKEGNLVLN